ncbi:MAG: SMI1/KNR4 family protein [Anaerolineales bacterium]|nr:SMI1/KNR4 family protein [Anaerolineales bacterium]
MNNLIEKYKDQLPELYLDFLRNEDGFSGYLDDELGYVSLWNLSELVDSWNGYEVIKDLGEDWFPIGSNGGGEMIAIKLSSENAELFFIPFIGWSGDEDWFYCDDFSILYNAINESLLK